MKPFKSTLQTKAQRQEPLYRILIESLRREIASAGREPMRLPTGRELCVTHGVSHMTVRKAMEILSAEGLIVRTPRRGTFVVPPQKNAYRDVAGLAVAINIPTEASTRNFMSLELLGANDFLQKQDVHVVIKETPDHLDAVQMFVSSLVRNRVGGFLCHSYDEAVMRATVAAAHAAALPIVVLNDRVDDLPEDYVTCDNYLGGMMAADYLLSLGHRRIAFVTEADHATQSERWDGLQHRVARAGGEAVRFPVWQSSSHLERFLADCGSFTSVFCGHDGTAAMVILQLMHRGLRVPDDISVIGYDNSLDICEHASIPITTIAQPAREMGARAAQLLHEKMSGQTVAGPRRIKLPPKLVVRASAAPPK